MFALVDSFVCVCFIHSFKSPPFDVALVALTSVLFVETFDSNGEVKPRPETYKHMYG